MKLVNRQALLAYGLQNRLKSLVLLVAMGGLTFLIMYWALGLLALVIFAGIILGFLGYRRQFGLDHILQAVGARPLSPYENGRFYNIATELARRAKLSHVPKLYYVNNQSRNAFTVGDKDKAAIAFSFGLLRTLNERELVGVMAHEISHIRNGDLNMMQLSDLITRYSGALSLLAQFLIVFFLPLAIIAGQMQIFFALLGLVLLPLINQLLQQALSRTREYHADLGAVELTGDPISLASALQKLEQSQQSFLAQLFGLKHRRQVQNSLLQSHPVTQERIDRLLAMANKQVVRAYAA